MLLIRLPETSEILVARDAAQFRLYRFLLHPVTLPEHHHSAKLNSNITYRRSRVIYPIHDHCHGFVIRVVGFQSYRGFSRPNVKTRTLSARCPAMTDLGTGTNKRMVWRQTPQEPASLDTVHSLRASEPWWRTPPLKMQIFKTVESNHGVECLPGSSDIHCRRDVPTQSTYGNVTSAQIRLSSSHFLPKTYTMEGIWQKTSMISFTDLEVKSAWSARRKALDADEKEWKNGSFFAFPGMLKRLYRAMMSDYLEAIALSIRKDGQGF